MIKEYLYVGHYEDISGRYILKIGTTNDLDRRAKEHTRNYKKPTVKCGCQMKKGGKFEYDWWLPLSKYNTIRYEDRNRTRWIEEKQGVFVDNDRFIFDEKPPFVEIIIRKSYPIAL